jgi:hypothetical protein
MLDWGIGNRSSELHGGSGAVVEFGSVMDLQGQFRKFVASWYLWAKRQFALVLVYLEDCKWALMRREGEREGEGTFGRQNGT